MRERFAMLGRVRFEVVDTEEIGDRLYVEVIARGRGSSGGVPVEMRSFWVYDYAEDGRVIRWRGVPRTRRGARSGRAMNSGP
jgi:hypothetical protein